MGEAVGTDGRDEDKDGKDEEKNSYENDVIFSHIFPY